MACAPAKTKVSLDIHPVFFAVHFWVAKVLIMLLRADSKYWSDVQADLRLCWAHIQFCLFCHAAAQLIEDVLVCIEFYTDT